jgi:hypothetical protein
MGVKTGAGGRAGSAWAEQMMGNAEIEAKSRAASRRRARAELGIAKSSVAVRREQSTAIERFREFFEKGLWSSTLESKDDSKTIQGLDTLVVVVEASQKRGGLGFSCFPPLFAGKSEKGGARRFVRIEALRNAVNLNLCFPTLAAQGWGTEACAD